MAADDSPASGEPHTIRLLDEVERQHPEHRDRDRDVAPPRDPQQRQVGGDREEQERQELADEERRRHQQAHDDQPAGLAPPGAAARDDQRGHPEREQPGARHVGQHHAGRPGDLLPVRVRQREERVDEQHRGGGEARDVPEQGADDQVGAGEERDAAEGRDGEVRGLPVSEDRDDEPRGQHETDAGDLVRDLVERPLVQRDVGPPAGREPHVVRVEVQRRRQQDVLDADGGRGDQQGEPDDAPGAADAGEQPCGGAAGRFGVALGPSIGFACRRLGHVRFLPSGRSVRAAGTPNQAIAGG
ncbi:hypothetical protein BJF79_19135 [Actinomadura sp. CNU-125]|nr:hypothetical protein BJF79_19135 [Actinomadura sp. CNU-125]